MLARTPEVPRRSQEVARVVRVCIDVESVHQEPFESNTSEGQATASSRTRATVSSPPDVICA
jgi:hypothetical protein